jgi:hypothetical protein
VGEVRGEVAEARAAVAPERAVHLVHLQDVRPLLEVLDEVQLGVAFEPDRLKARVSAALFEEAGLQGVVGAGLDGAALVLADDRLGADHELVALAAPVDTAAEAAQVQVGAGVLEELVEGVCGVLVARDAVGLAVADPAQSSGRDAVANEVEVGSLVVGQAAAGAHGDDGDRGLQGVPGRQREAVVDLPEGGFALLDVGARQARGDDPVAVGVHRPDEQQGASGGVLVGLAVAFAQLAGRFDLESDVDALASAAGAGAGGAAHDVRPARGCAEDARRRGGEEDLDEIARGRGAVRVVRGAGALGFGCHEAGHRRRTFGVLAKSVARRVRLVRPSPAKLAR